MRLSEVDAERLGPLHHAGDVGVAAQEVVDELAPQRLLVPDHLPPCGLVSLDEGGDGVVEHAEHRLGRCPDLFRVARTRTTAGSWRHSRQAAER